MSVPSGVTQSPMFVVRTDALRALSDGTVEPMATLARSRRFAPSPTGPVADPALGERPEYLDRLAVRALGFKRQDADRIFRALPVVSLPGARKCYVRRADLDELLASHTYRGDRVRPTR